MWFVLHKLSQSGLNLAESIQDLIQSTSRKLFYLITGISLCISIFMTATYPQRYGWESLALIAFLIGICYLANLLLDKKILLSLIVFLTGFTIAISLSIITFHQPIIGFLLPAVPLLAVITIGWPAFIISELAVAAIVWLNGHFVLSITGTIGNTIILCGLFSGLIGWITVHSLLTVTQWSLDSYKKANEDLQEARDRRVILLQTQEDLLQANRELARLSDRLKITNQIAEEARRAKEEFVANVSHELRTPLNMIIGFSETITQSPNLYGKKLPPALLADIDVIQRNSMHLSRLVDDVLDLSQVDAGRMALTLERTSIYDIIDSAVIGVKPLFETKKLFLHVETSPDLPEILCDKTRIRQVIINLLSNSGRFTETGGVIIRVKREQDGIILSVTDTGPGISEENQNRLFEPFQQLDGMIHTKHGGSGLGLSISKRFVEMHGGKIWLESELGEGTTFFVSLPLDREINRDEVQLTPLRWINPNFSFHQRTRSSRVSKQKINPRYVILESGQTLSRLFSRYLPESEIISVARPVDALEHLRQIPAQALIVNATNTEDSAVQQLISTPLPFDTPVILCWMPGKDNREQFGVVNYLVKPVKSTELIKAVTTLGKKIQTILIIDDEPDLQRLFTRIIMSDKKKIRILSAANPIEALEYLKTERVDAIILDLIMPGMNGFDFLSIKAQDETIRDIPVVVVTSRDPSNQPITSNQLTITRSNGLSTNDLLACVQALCNVLTPIIRSDGPTPSEKPDE